MIVGVTLAVTFSWLAFSSVRRVERGQLCPHTFRYRVVTHLKTPIGDVCEEVVEQASPSLDLLRAQVGATPGAPS